MGGLTEEHAGCHGATSAAGCWLPADAYTPGRPRCRHRRWWYQVHAVRPGRRLVVRAQFSASTESGAAVRQRFARGPSERRSLPRYHDAVSRMSELRTSCPRVGRYAYLRRETWFDEQPCTRSRRACFEALHARTQRPSQSRGPAPERWWALALSGSARTRRPVTSNAGLSLLTAQCGLDAGLTAAGERPRAPWLPRSLDHLSSSNRRCATSSRLPVRDATALSALVAGPERGPRPPSGSVSRRRS